MRHIGCSLKACNSDIYALDIPSVKQDRSVTISLDIRNIGGPIRSDNVDINVDRTISLDILTI